MNRDHPEYFKTSEAFINNVFKGIYAKNDYGNGTILYVDQINLNVVIRCHEKDSLGNNLKKKMVLTLYTIQPVLSLQLRK